MTQQTEAGDVGGRVCALLDHDLGRTGIGRQHQLGDTPRALQRVEDSSLVLERRGQDADAQRLGEDQQIARLSRSLAQDPIRMDDAGHGPVRTAARDCLTVCPPSTEHTDAGRTRDQSAQHLGQDVERQARVRESGHRQRRNRARPHGVDVGETVDGRDAPVVVGIVDHGGLRAIHRRHQRQILAHTNDPAIVWRFEPDERVRMGEDRQSAQNLRQLGWAGFCRSQPAQVASCVSRMGVDGSSMARVWNWSAKGLKSWKRRLR
ncbi:MAG: hypothetical protein MZV65_42470 [Chromatiales bacterium]|nr:hypothetical protein [Chromatiales bacterium]